MKFWDEKSKKLLTKEELEEKAEKGKKSSEKGKKSSEKQPVEISKEEETPMMGE